jgi:hypothetical protein
MLGGLCTLSNRQLSSQRGIYVSKDLGPFRRIAAAILDRKMEVPGNVGIRFLAAGSVRTHDGPRHSCQLL